MFFRTKWRAYDIKNDEAGFIRRGLRRNGKRAGEVIMRALYKNNRGSRKIATAAMSAMLALLTPYHALLAQTGAVVTSGAADIARTGNVTNINQSTEKAAINWQTFNIRPDETVNFNQPGASSVTLNRVIGNERSVLEGALNANGQVFLLNSSGVLITQGASVNTGGFLASTLNLSDDDFNAGRYIFQGFKDAGDGAGAVVNQGTITTKDGGYAVLLGKAVSNQGIITADRGAVVLASGDKIRLNFNDDSLLGVIIDEGTLGALVENKGAIIADGGRVFLTAKAAGELFDSQVNTNGRIQAQTIDDLKGDIEIHAHGGTANIAGTLDASAPDIKNSGDGGFIETSGDIVKISDGVIVTTLSATGANGEWLIDPDGFTVGMTTNDGDMSASTLNANLANGNVTISSANGDGLPNNDGNININGAVGWSENTLTLDATNNVFVNNTMTATGAAGLTVNYGTGTNADETPMGLYTAVTDSNARIDFSGAGELRMGGELYTVINTASQLAAARNNPKGRYALGNNINMSTITGWTPLDNNAASGFTGMFNGLGHEINNFTGVNSLFGNIGGGAAIANLSIYRAQLSVNSTGARTSAGILADVNRGSIVNTAATGIGVLNAADAGTNFTAVGGLVGINYGLIAQSRSTTAVRSVSTTGGLVGVNESAGRIIDSWASGGSISAGTNITTPVAGSVGGLVGVNSGTVRRAYATNAISLDGRIDSRLSVGGFVGKNAGIIEESYSASGSLTDYNTAPNFGGFVGENTGVIADAYSTRLYGYRSDVEWSAGFAYSNSGVIRNAYAVSSANNRNNVYYGFSRNNTGTLENVYWTANIYGGGFDLPRQTTGATFLTIDAAKNFSSYNFVANMPDIWGASQSGHPILRNIPVYIRTDNDSSFYGGATSGISSLKLSATGLQGGGGEYLQADNLSAYNPFTVSAAATGGYIDAGAWNASVVLTGSPYANIYGSVKVRPQPLSIQGVVEDKIYDGTTNAVLNNNVSNGGLAGLVGDQTLDIIYTSAAFQNGNAGTGKGVDIAYTVSDGANGGKTSNYVLPDATQANIDQRLIDVVVIGADRNYDGTTDAVANIEVVSGVIEGDSVATVYESAYFDDKNAGNRNMTVSGITLSGADAGNYTLGGANSVTTTAVVTPLPLTLYGTVDEGSPLTVGAESLNAANVVQGDAVTLSGSAKIATSIAGAQPIIDFSGLTVDNPNYTVVGSVGSVIVGDANLVFDRVTAGEAFINTSGKTTTVTQTTDKAVIDWLRFSLGADETLTFDQPSETSIVLNRVVTNLPGVIEGALKANGRVFILNGGGILFTANSSVNVGGLVAGTFNLTNENFLNDNYVFTVARGGGSIISLGDIVIADGGFIALAGGQGVDNAGTITGGGLALLTSTDELRLDINGFEYGVGNLTGVVTAGGAVSLGNGGVFGMAGDTVTLTGGFVFDAGSGGAWNWEQNGGVSIGSNAGEGFITGDFVKDNLAARDFSLTSRSGDIAINTAINWSANTTLSLNAGNDVNINKSINATGAGAGLSLNAGGDYRLTTPATFSGATLDATGKPVARQIPAGTELSSVSLSGANASLKINGDSYTLIHGMDDFAAIDGKTGWFALAGDIDASAWSGANSGSASVVGAMSGTLAGLGHTISNLTLNAPGKDYVGLIGEMPAIAATSNVIRDIGVLDVDIVGNNRIGALAGATTDVVVSQAYGTGKISGNMLVGGLIGAASETEEARATGGAQIKNSYSAVNISAASGYIGGLLGGAYAVTITDSHATGGIVGTRGGYWRNETTGEIINMLDERGIEIQRPNDGGQWTAYVMPSNNVGGLVGQTYYGNINNSYATGNISTVDGSSVGGMIGSLLGTTGMAGLPQAVTNSFATGNVIGGTRIGGLIGDVGGANQGGNTVFLDNVYATGDVIGTHESSSGVGGMIGGLIGNAIDVSVNNAFATGNVITSARNPTSFMGGLLGYSGGSSNISNSFATGTIVGNTGSYTGGLVGGGSEGSALSDSFYRDAAYQAASESAPARSETGRIVDDVQAREAEETRNVVNSVDGGDPSARDTDQYIEYGDSDDYSARVRAISVEEDDEECNENDECPHM